ncbi:unnamed protein product [Peniophora sp. CBMAI 1063]|nr:unnamed protein product [Peniophora sp. CBMAI 1063]
MCRRICCTEKRGDELQRFSTSESESTGWSSCWRVSSFQLRGFIARAEITWLNALHSRSCIFISSRSLTPIRSYRRNQGCRSLNSTK